MRNSGLTLWAILWLVLMKPFASRVLVRVSIVAFVGHLGAWAFLFFRADESAPATLLLFGPRWILALPLVILLPLAIIARSYVSIAIMLLAALVIAGPIMGGTISTRRLFASDHPALQQIRVVSWNMGGTKGGAAFHHFLNETSPTLLVCQESTLVAADLPPGWTVLGEHGNRVATRMPIRPGGSRNFNSLGISGQLDRFILDTPDGEVVLIDLHLPTPRPGIEAAMKSKLGNLTELRRLIEIRGEAARIARAWIGPPVPRMILAGDFNMPVESRIYRDNWSSFPNAFSEMGNGWGTTKQTQWFGARIDHILYTSPWHCRKAWVGPAMGSDHRPMISDLALEDY